jgi:hypothetical protein
MIKQSTQADCVAIAKQAEHWVTSGFYGVPVFGAVLFNQLPGSFSQAANPSALIAPSAGIYEATFKYSGQPSAQTGVDISIYKNGAVPVATARVSPTPDGFGNVLTTGPLVLEAGDALTVNVNVSAQGASVTFYKHNPGSTEDSMVFTLKRVG